MRPQQEKRQQESGFTFIEVLLAIVIFVIAIIAALDLTRGSVKATQETKEITTATWLLKKVIVELETHVETDGFDKACDKKKTGKFDPPYDKYTWETSCEQIDFKLSETAAALLDKDKDKDKDSSSDTQENMLKKMILNLASDYVSKSMRELHAEVHWVQGKTPRKIDVTTHIARYDQPFTLPAMGVGTGTGS